MVMKEWALKYADLGFAVFPIKPPRMGGKTPGKEPLTAHGFQDATMDKKQIERWWKSCPDANIGIATGSRSGGIVVIDLDEDEEKDKHGYEVLKEWQREHGELPETWQSITGRGGYHLIYRDFAEYKNRTGLYDGIDIRGEGGYIVAPPSLHQNGRRYEWEQGPGDCDIAQANNTVINFMMGPEPEERKKQGFEAPETIPDGQRHSVLIALIGSLKAKGLDDGTIREAVQSENEKKCVPPFTNQELEKTIFPALKRGWKAEAPYYSKTVCDNGQARPVKVKNFHLSNAADVEIKEPEWLIPGYIPKYGITTIAGEGGVGKTSIWCSIVACITTGEQSFLVNGKSIPFKNEPQNVVVFSAEDSWNYVLKQRLINNGADMNRIFYMGPEDERFTDLNFNGDLLKGIIETNRPDMVVYDPVQAFVPANLRMGDRNAMRKCFSPLIGFGETYKTTSIVIAHANKQSGVWGRKRIADSSDIWDASRSVLMTGIVPNSDGLRYISHEKSNWGKLQDSVVFELSDGVPIFKNYSAKKDREFIIEDSKIRNNVPAAEEAKDFILETLNEHKQMEVAELDELAKVEGISKNALKDAKTALRKEGVTHTWSIGNWKQDGKKFFIALKGTEKINE